MTPIEQERDRVQDLLTRQRQQWQDINARMSQNFSNRPLYARLEMELKQTEREIARLELMLEDPNAFENVPLITPEEMVVPSPKLVRKRRRPASPMAIIGVFAAMIVVLVATAIWLFLLRGTSTPPGTILPPGNASIPSIQPSLSNGNFAADLSGWSARLNDTTKAVFRTQATADNRQYRALNLEHAGSGSGTVGQAVKLANRNLKFSAFASGRADDAANKQGYAYLLVQYLDRNGQPLGGTVFSAAPANLNVPAFADTNRYRVQPLGGVLSEYTVDIQGELSRLSGIDAAQVDAVNILIYAGAASETAQCQPTECRAEIAVADVKLA
jgi:hypothetical protein